MYKKNIREKKHRLDPELYKGEAIISFTLCIKDRKVLFNGYNIFKTFETVLLNELVDFDCSAYVYLFMPDHLHLLLSGNNPDSNIKKCLDMFKQKTGFWLSKNNESVKWQKDYYDHFIMSEENLDIHINYILNNPVRAGIVRYWKEYKFKGSTIYNLDEWD